MRQQLGLGLDQCGKLGLQHLGNALVIVLPRALEQRLIRRVLDERMLERVGRLGWQTSLVHQFGVHQSTQLTLQGGVVQLRDRLE